MSDTEQIFDFADRAFREALDDADNLRAVLRRVLGPVSDGFDYSHRRMLPRDFLLPNWKGRERDFLCEMPFRLPEGELWALVCILLEHQTRPDPQMPLRTLIYTVFYWEKRLREWEASASPRAEFRLPPVVPIVLHASSKGWTGPRTLADLLDEPSAFHPFAPRWEPLFWEVGNDSVEDLLHHEDAFLQVLAMVRTEDAEREEALRVYRELLKKLAGLRETNAARWTHLLRFALGWVLNRRPKGERAEWLRVTEENQNDVLAKEEIRNMEQTIAQSLVEQGIEVGLERGRTEALQGVIVEIGAARLGNPNAAIQAAVQAITDIGRLRKLVRRIQEVSSWDELLKESSIS
jgi:Putative transposase, YhgA-like